MSWMNKFRPAKPIESKKEENISQIKQDLIVADDEPEVEVYKDDVDNKPSQNISSEVNSKAVEMSKIDEESDLNDEDTLLAELEAKKAQILEAKRIREEEAKKALENAQVSAENISTNELERVLMSFESRLTAIEAALFRLGAK